MEYAHPLNEAVAAVRENKLPALPEDDLRAKLRACVTYYASNPNSVQASDAITAIREELRSREEKRRHIELLDEAKKRHVELLEKVHWSQTPGFWVAVLTMIFAAIAAWPVIRSWFP